MKRNEEIIRLAARLKEVEVAFYQVNQARISQLLEICREYQGEYLDSDHGPGSWATTYSNEFIQASAELYSIFSECKLFSPLIKLSQCFRDECIKSCRGADMSLDRVEYLYNAHLKRLIEK